MEIGFLLKKCIAFFVEPLGLILALFAIGLLFLFQEKSRSAKISLSLSFTLLLLFSYEPFSNFLLFPLEKEYPKYSTKEKVGYIHVLGSGHNTDSSQPLSSNLGNVGIKRVVEGVVLYKSMEDVKIIFSGYEGKTQISNARINAKLAIALGVEERDIILAEKPKDTLQEALFAKEIIGEAPFILVTSATHMPRAMELFSSLGMHPIAAPTAFYAKEQESYLKAPDTGSLDNTQMAIHEYLGRLWGKIH